MFCHKCGAKNTEGAAFCLKCGAKQEYANNKPQATPQPDTVTTRTPISSGTPDAPVPLLNNTVAPKKSKSKKNIGILAGVVGAVVLAVVVLIVISNGTEEPLPQQNVVAADASAAQNETLAPTPAPLDDDAVVDTQTVRPHPEVDSDAYPTEEPSTDAELGDESTIGAQPQLESPGEQMQDTVSDEPLPLFITDPAHELMWDIHGWWIGTYLSGAGVRDIYMWVFGIGNQTFVRSFLTDNRGHLTGLYASELRFNTTEWRFETFNSHWLDGRTGTLAEKYLWFLHDDALTGHMNPRADGSSREEFWYAFERYHGAWLDFPRAYLWDPYYGEFD